MATNNIQSFPGDVTVTSNLTVDTNTLHVDAVSGRVGIGSTLPKAKLDVANRFRIYSNLTVGNTLHVDTVARRIGIGTTLPDEALVVKRNQASTVRIGNLNMYTSGTSAFISATNHASSTNYAIQQEDPAAGKHTSINHPSGKKIFFRSGNVSATASAIKGNKFGIGTTDPKFTLDVNGEVRQNLPFFAGRGVADENTFVEGNIQNIDGTYRNVLNRNSTQVTIPTGANGIYHVYCQLSLHVNNTSYSNRGISAYCIRDRGGSITEFQATLQWIDVVSGSTYRQMITDYIMDLNSGDKVYWTVSDRSGDTDVHMPNTLWYVKMIMPT